MITIDAPRVCPSPKGHVIDGIYEFSKIKERDASFDSMNGRPTVVVTRHLSSPSRRTATMESSTFNQFIPKRNTTTDVATAVKQSKLLAALDALSLNKDDDDDSEVEIIAAGPAAIEARAGTTTKGSKLKPRLNTERVATHPFFVKDTCSEPRRTSTKENADFKLPSRTIPNSNMKPDGRRAPMTTEQIVRTSTRLGPGASTSITKGKNGGARRNMETLSKSLEVSARSYSYKDYSPTPMVVYTRHEEEANDLVASLKKGPLGFDMEWRVLWTRKANSAESVAQDRRVAIIQLADTAGMILVIQVFAMSRFPKKLQELIEDPQIPKLGANISNDGTKLLNDYGILAKNLLELGALVHMADPAGGEFLAGSRSPQWKNIIALAKLVAQYCKKTLEKPKNLRMGNWEAELNAAQVDYAASDAHCAIKIYERLLELADQNGIPLTDENIQRRCSSSVPLPYRKLTKLPSCSDVQMEEARPLTGQVRRFATMPNVGTSYATGLTSGMRPQNIRAYHLWYKEGMSLEQMCSKLRLKTEGNAGTISSENSTAPDLSKEHDDGPDEEKQVMITGSNSLKASTVIGYVIGALQTDTKLPFDMDKLRELVQMDGSSWERHHDWLLRVWREGRGVAY